MFFTLQKFEEIAKLFPRMLLHVTKPKLKGTGFACQMQYVIDPNHITCFLTAISCIYHARKVTDKFQGVTTFSFLYSNLKFRYVDNFEIYNCSSWVENIFRDL